MRISKPELTRDDLIQEVIHSGKQIIVRNYKGGNNLKVRSLKRLNRTAYDSHLVEFEIGNEKVRVNIEDVRESLKYV